jgi:D-tyrosyl-tRNA(Tyr) deacylase
MIGLLQRVSSASVRIDERLCGEIGVGLLVLIGVSAGDTPAQAQRLAQRLLDYRVFPDGEGRMNLSLKDIGGGLLLVPQFTLAADTQSGNRPGFSTAAPPAHAQPLFEALVAATRGAGGVVATGEFGAHMQVSLVNDGPVTFWLET